MNFWTVTLGAIIVVFVLALIQYVHKKKSRICEICNSWTWDGICPHCRAKIFPEEKKEKNKS